MIPLGPGASETGASPTTVLYLDSGQSGDDTRAFEVARRAPQTPAKRQVVIELAPLQDLANVRKVGRQAVWWLVVVLLSGVLVAYLVGPLFAAHSQRKLTQELQLAVQEAYGAAHDSLTGADPITRAPAFGSAVAVVQIPRLQLQQTISEGASSSILRAGPGHVPGTAGIGQPGNSVVAGHRRAFGGPLGDANLLRKGDKIIVLTPQGKTLYTIQTVARIPVGDSIYDPTTTDQLTLLTSNSIFPWNGSTAIAITATMDTKPFVPTPQNGYAPVQDGRHGDSAAWSLLVLELAGLAITIAVALALYRRWSGPATYLITTPALLALTIFATLTGTRLLPGWF